jgi:hypothetical protein
MDASRSTLQLLAECCGFCNSSFAKELFSIQGNTLATGSVLLARDGGSEGFKEAADVHCVDGSANEDAQGSTDADKEI